MGLATVTVLKALHEGKRFGLDIMEATGLPSGTVYPTLGRMEERGFVAATWENDGQARAERRPRRRYYRLTPEGAIALNRALADLGFLTRSEVAGSEGHG